MRYSLRDLILEAALLVALLCVGWYLGVPDWPLFFGILPGAGD